MRHIKRSSGLSGRHGCPGSSRRSGSARSSAKAAGIHRASAYRWRQEDSEFIAAWADVEEETTDDLEPEALRRVTEGFDSGTEPESSPTAANPQSGRLK
jgi:hypothetical protein